MQENAVREFKQPKEETEAKPLWDLRDPEGNPEGFRDFMTHLARLTGNDFDTLTGLALLIMGIRDERHKIGVEDHCDHILDQMYEWTMEFSEGVNQWKEKIRQGTQARN
jgi:hypothetical protein